MKKTSTLPLLIDELGSLTDEANKIASRIKEIKEILKEQGVGEYDGKVYKAKVTSYRTVIYEKEKVAKKLGFQKYIACSELRNTELKKYISENDLLNFIEKIEENLKVSIEKIKK